MANERRETPDERWLFGIRGLLKLVDALHDATHLAWESDWNKLNDESKPTLDDLIEDLNAFIEEWQMRASELRKKFEEAE